MWGAQVSTRLECFFFCVFGIAGRRAAPALTGMPQRAKHFIEELDGDEFLISPTFFCVCVSSRGPLLSPGMKGAATPPPPLEKQHVHPHHKPYSHYQHHQSATDGKA